MSELSEFLTQDPVDFSYETFSIESLDRASWAMRKLASAQKRIDERKELALAEARKLDDWFLAACKSDQETVTFFENSLKAYMLHVREESGEKSLSLPDGEISSRSIPAKAVVADRELVIKWALANHREGWVREKLEVNLEAMKGDVSFDGESVIDTVTGEIVEGLVGVEPDISVTVKVTG